jgi:hypothetical protein
MDLEIDNNELMYVATRRRILRLTPDGINIDTLADLGSDYSKITDIKLGPGGFLYVLASKNELFRINLTTGQDEEYFKLSKKADYFDFDENLNIYIGRRDGLYVLTSDLQEVFTEFYDDEAIKELRVYNGYVYVATAKKLTRNAIIDEKGTVGEVETLFDLESESEFSSADINSFNIDINGRIMICLYGHSNYSLFVLENNYTLAPFYKESIIPKRVDQIIFGSGRHIYLNRGMSIDPVAERDSVKVFKMGLDNIGAPYFGRN